MADKKTRPGLQWVLITVTFVPPHFGPFVWHTLVHHLFLTKNGGKQNDFLKQIEEPQYQSFAEIELRSIYKEICINLTGIPSPLLRAPLGVISS